MTEPMSTAQKTVGAHVERPTKMAGGRTYCSCGNPWPCWSTLACPVCESTDDHLHTEAEIKATLFPDAPGMFAVGERVATEYGDGVVSESSTRRVVIDLDSGESINVATGTPGYGRVVRCEAQNG